MFVLIWTALLFSVRDVTADTGESMKETCYGGFCITLNEEEITAEAGLCVVIPCSFATGAGFRHQHIMWLKCEASKLTCGFEDIILNTDKKNKVQSTFFGRVSLLEPDVKKRNCSIIVNNLTESDSGFYQFRIHGLLSLFVNSFANSLKEDGYTFSRRATVSIKALTQKPSVLIPPLTEGRQTTLTCTAPGLCSGSDPEITWRWRGAGEKDSHITGNITGVTRRSSTLTFNPSAEHHGTNVTCKVSFTSSITTEETETLNVAYMKEPVITGRTTVREGDALNLTCSVESFPPSHITWTFLGSNTKLDIGPEKATGSATLVLPNMTTGGSGRYICTAQHLDKTMTTYADVTVTYQRGACAALPWVIVAVISLVVNVICIILLTLLWNTRKQVEPKQEDRTYMSLRKKDVSPEYDVIAQALN